MSANTSCKLLSIDIYNFKNWSVLSSLGVCSKTIYSCILVTYEELKALLANSKDLILIDVREKDEVDKGRIPRSIHIALGTVEAAFKMSPEAFQATYGIPKPALDAPELVFYCRSGKRSAEALSKVNKLGYVTARNYAGSYIEWCSREG
ncbi:hypothetical protein XENORESO_017095 [Xenotaenia resolanae]|uniref:Rhodanese domain-containing protein n=1 Tax=Xenotaenia resolanae TaxID=208358 RepID=A0ABV0VY59_9TELE